MIRIVVDGAADMPDTWAEDYGIHVLPLHVRFGEEVFTQGPDFTRDDFYRLVNERRIIPKSSLPSIGQVKAFYEAIAQPGDTILSIHISSKLSGTYAAVTAAAAELADRFPIHVIDSAAGSAAQAFLAREARLRERAGATLQEIITHCEAISRRWTCVFTLQTLEYAHLSGRVNALQKWVAAALQVNPVIVLNDGLLQVAEQVRTRQRALARVIERAKQQAGDRLVNCAVVHAADPETAQALYRRLQDCLNIQLGVITDLSVVVAANLGPGAIGLFAYPLEQE